MPDHSPLPESKRPVPRAAAQPRKITLTEQYAEHKRVAGQVERELRQAIQRIEERMGAKIAKLDKFAEQRVAAEKRSAINARLDTLLKQGKILPAELEAGLADVAFQLDAVKVQKFAEKGKLVEMTALDRFFKTLEGRPPILKLAERFKDPSRPEGGTEEAEVEKVVQFFNENEAAFTSVRQTKEGLVEGFKNYRKNHPGAPADRFLAGKAG